MSKKIVFTLNPFSGGLVWRGTEAEYNALEEIELTNAYIVDGVRRSPKENPPNPLNPPKENHHEPV